MKRMMLTVLLTVALAAALAGCGGGAAGDRAGQEGHDHAGGHDGHGEHVSAASQAEWTVAQGKPQAGQPVDIGIRVKDAHGKPVTKFDVRHEKLMHLIVVSEDLSYFDHLHPDYEEEDGSFAVRTTFPSGGKYKLFADYAPGGGEDSLATHWLNVGGDGKPADPLKPDPAAAVVADGTEVTLEAGSLTVGAETELRFRLTDAATREPVDDLEPYLGALGHVVIVSEGARLYAHVHPLDDGGSGPVAAFAASFPAPGLYKMWAQFQRDGRVLTAPFVVEVGAGG